MHHLIQEMYKKLEDIYPVIFVTNLPINDFAAAADETLRMSDRNIMQRKLKSFLKSFARSLIEKEIEELEGMKKDEEYGMDVQAFKGTIAARNHNRSFNLALSTRIEQLTSVLQELKNK